MLEEQVSKIIKKQSNFADSFPKRIRNRLITFFAILIGKTKNTLNSKSQNELPKKTFSEH
jgi:hypothetical protein